MRVPGRRTALLALASCLVIGASAACTESPSEPDRPVDVAITLAPGQSQAIAGTALTVRFVGVTGDSRCPADAMCVLGGDAVVAVDLSVSGGASLRVELHTGDNRPARYDRFTLTMVQLSPYPFSAHPIEPGEYRLTLRITG